MLVHSLFPPLDRNAQCHKAKKRKKDQSGDPQCHKMNNRMTPQSGDAQYDKTNKQTIAQEHNVTR